MCSLFFYSGALSPFISNGSILSGFKQGLPTIGSVITLVLICLHRNKILPIIFREKTLWLLVLLAVFSIGWSDIPDQTQVFVVALLRVTLFGIYFATRFSLREQLRILVLVFGALAVGSFLFGAFLPTYGVMGVGFIANSQDTTHTGAWRGLFIHKVFLGSMMTLSGLLCWVNILDQSTIVSIPKRRAVAQTINDDPDLFQKLNRSLIPIYYFGIFISALVLLMSTTKAAILVVCIAIFLLPFYESLRWSYFHLIPFILLSLVSCILLLTALISNAELLLGLIDREITISGRTIYWGIMWQEIQERFWWGYGYEAFWQGGWRGQVGEVWRYLLPGNEPPHAHNGYLMLLFDTGLVGLALFGLNFILGYVNAMRFVRFERSVIGLVPITYLTMTVFFNLTESLIMRPDIFWVLYISSILSVHRELKPPAIYN